MIRVLLTVSSPAMRAGLQALLSSDKAITVVNDLLEDDTEADVVITSASVVSFAENESAAILFLRDEQFNVEEMKRSNRVWGILPTESSAEELIAAIHALSQGLIVGTPTLLFESEDEPHRARSADREGIGSHRFIGKRAGKQTDRTGVGDQRTHREISCLIDIHKIERNQPHRSRARRSARWMDRAVVLLF